jgi:hypothetical protein
MSARHIIYYNTSKMMFTGIYEKKIHSDQINKEKH